MVVDYVVPMVFHQDAEWRKNFAKVGGTYNEYDFPSFVRYRSWNTERLLVKCIKKFLPWIRTIYILLAQESQKQPWMDDEEVRIVYHRDFIPQRHLPTFNSRTIEMFLKDIPGLSEYFLYGNDDVFPIKPLEETDFFKDGKPCLLYKEKKFPANPNNFHIAARGGLNFVAKEFGKHYVTTWLKDGHSITPMVKSTWEMLWRRGRLEIDGRISPFREERNFNQWLCPWWHYLSGNYVEHAPRRKYVSTKNTIEEVVSALQGEAEIVCVNDNECVWDYQRYGTAVRKTLEQLTEDNDGK